MGGWRGVNHRHRAGCSRKCSPLAAARTPTPTAPHGYDAAPNTVAPTAHLNPHGCSGHHYEHHGRLVEEHRWRKHRCYQSSGRGSGPSFLFTRGRDVTAIPTPTWF